VTALPALGAAQTDGVVTLRRSTLHDVAAVTRACQDPEIPRWTAGIPEPYEERHARGWIILHDPFWSSEGRAAFAFCDARSGELLGSMALDPEVRHEVKRWILQTNRLEEQVRAD
jgi:RimJ/RimL family protein N-acetyltransferase